METKESVKPTEGPRGSPQEGPRGSPQEGPRGSPQEGPRGEVEVDSQLIQKLNILVTDLFNTSQKIIEQYMNNPDLYKSEMKEIGLISLLDVTDEVFIKEFHRYKQSYFMSKNESKKDNHLSLFTQLLSNEGVFMTRLGNDSWIRGLDKPVKLMFASNVGKTSTIALHLGQLYRISVAIKGDHEKKIKNYPEIYKPDEKNKYPLLILYNCFRIFQLTPINDNPEKSKALSGIVNDLSIKLGIKSATSFNPNTLKDSLSPVFSIGADLLNKAQAKNPGPPGTQPIRAENIAKIFDKVLNNDSMSKMMDGFKNAAQNNSGPPDLGSLIGSLMQNINPEDITQNLQSAVQSELPGMFKAQESSGPSSGPSPNNISTNIEETIEEIEEIEEIIEETDK
jgi:hypothetical protein